MGRELGVSQHATISTWKAKYKGLNVNEAKRLRHLEEENRRLKQLVANLSREPVTPLAPANAAGRLIAASNS